MRTATRNAPIKMKMAKLIMVAIAVVLSSCTTPSEMAVTHLKCDYRNNPLGIDNTQPQMSWRLEETNFARGQQQTAYQLLVASSPALLDGNT